MALRQRLIDYNVDGSELKEELKNAVEFVMFHYYLRDEVCDKGREESNTIVVAF